MKDAEGKEGPYSNAYNGYVWIFRLVRQTANKQRFFFPFCLFHFTSSRNTVLYGCIYVYRRGG